MYIVIPKIALLKTFLIKCPPDEMSHCRCRSASSRAFAVVGGVAACLDEHSPMAVEERSCENETIERKLKSVSRNGVEWPVTEKIIFTLCVTTLKFFENFEI